MVKVIEVNQGVFAENDRIAAGVREKLKRQHTFMINLMSSPGAGKTSTLLRTAEALKGEFRIGVMEADLDASVDAERMQAAGIRTIQVHTNGNCAMDAEMTRAALEEFPTEDLDLLVLENVGNLVCPAETDTGASQNVVILSVPEGDDKPLKYPLMFEVCGAVLINKTDTRAYFDFDDEKVRENILFRNPAAEIFFCSAKTGEGFDAWIAWLRAQIRRGQAGAETDRNGVREAAGRNVVQDRDRAAEERDVAQESAGNRAAEERNGVRELTGDRAAEERNGVQDGFRKDTP